MFFMFFIRKSMFLSSVEQLLYLSTLLAISSCRIDVYVQFAVYVLKSIHLTIVSSF